MSIHIGGKPGDIAETVLFPGDPLRAKYIAEKFLDDLVCYSEVRGMLGFTGNYNGMRVSVQGGGMGIPSNAIYLHEMIYDYGVNCVIRVGTCGGITEDLPLGSVILANGASTDSNMNPSVFPDGDYAPVPDFDLLRTAVDVARDLDVDHVVGGIFSTDTYYDNGAERWKVWADHGVKGVEMESSMLYTKAAKAGAKALSILTVSDIIPLNLHIEKPELMAAVDTISKIALESALKMNQ